MLHFKNERCWGPEFLGRRGIGPLLPLLLNGARCLGPADANDSVRMTHVGGLRCWFWGLQPQRFPLCLLYLEFLFALMTLQAPRPRPGTAPSVLSLLSPTHLKQIEAHVVAKDVEELPSGVPPFDPPGLKKVGVAELVAGRECKAQSLGVPETVQDVDNGAASCLVGLQEHQVLPGLARDRGRLAEGSFLPHFGWTTPCSWEQLRQGDPKGQPKDVIWLMYFSCIYWTGLRGRRPSWPDWPLGGLCVKGGWGVTSSERRRPPRAGW